MRVESSKLPQAAQTHSKVHGGGRSLPEAASDKAKGTTGESYAAAENLAVSSSESAAKPAKTAPPGLENAISRHEAKSKETPGLANALEMLQRNLSRYQTATDPVSPPPATEPPASETPAEEVAAATPPVTDAGEETETADSTGESTSDTSTTEV